MLLQRAPAGPARGPARASPAGPRSTVATRSSWPERIELDLWYIEHRSLALDLQILWLTVRGWCGPAASPARAGSTRAFRSTVGTCVREPGRGGRRCRGTRPRGAGRARRLQRGSVPTYDVLGVLDDGPTEVNLSRLKSRDVRHLGGVQEWLVAGEHSDVRYLVGIGTARARRAVDARMTAAGLEPATVVHPCAVRGFDVRLAPGCVVFAGAVLATNIGMGRHTHRTGAPPSAMTASSATTSRSTRRRACPGTAWWRTT